MKIKLRSLVGTFKPHDFVAALIMFLLVAFTQYAKAQNEPRVAIVTDFFIEDRGLVLAKTGVIDKRANLQQLISADLKMQVYDTLVHLLQKYFRIDTILNIQPDKINFEKAYWTSIRKFRKSDQKTLDSLKASLLIKIHISLSVRPQLIFSEILTNSHEHLRIALFAKDGDLVWYKNFKTTGGSHIGNSGLVGYYYANEDKLNDFKKQFYKLYQKISKGLTRK